MARVNGAATKSPKPIEMPLRTNSNSSVPPPGQTLTGKQEHCALSPRDDLSMARSVRRVRANQIRPQT